MTTGRTEDYDHETSEWEIARDRTRRVRAEILESQREENARLLAQYERDGWHLLDLAGVDTEPLKRMAGEPTRDEIPVEELPEEEADQMFRDPGNFFEDNIDAWLNASDEEVGLA